jgi:hypothetical protein
MMGQAQVERTRVRSAREDVTPEHVTVDRTRVNAVIENVDTLLDDIDDALFDTEVVEGELLAADSGDGDEETCPCGEPIDSCPLAKFLLKAGKLR